MLDKIMNKGDVYYPSAAGKKFKIAKDVWFIEGADPIINLPNAADSVWMKVSDYNVGEKVFFKGIVMTDFFKDGIKYLIFRADKNQEVYGSLNFQFRKINPYYTWYLTNWDNQAYMVDASRVIWGVKPSVRVFLHGLPLLFERWWSHARFNG